MPFDWSPHQSLLHITHHHTSHTRPQHISIFQTKIFMQQGKLRKKGISCQEAVMFWSFPEAWVLFYWLGGFHSQQNTTTPRLHTHPRQHNHKSKHNNFNTTQTRKLDDRNTNKHPNQNNNRIWESNTKSQSLQCHRSGLLIFHSRSGFKVCVHELWKQNIQALLGSDQRIPSSWRFLVWLNELSFLCTLIIGIIGS